MSLALAEPATAPHAVLEAEDTGVFRILQIADFHSDVDENMNARTRQDVRAMIGRFRPHLLAVTGDIWCGEEHPDAAPMWMARDLEVLGGLGLPWAFIWGNHDYCADFEDASAQIAATPNAIAPHGNGEGSFRIELVLPREAGPRWDLFFINSGERWQMPHDLEWLRYEAEHVNHLRGAAVPAVAYFHIPLRNYQDAIDERRTIGYGSEEVIGWGDDAGFGPALIKEVENVRLCFASHSHRNDFYFEEDGIIFAYGRATGHGGYGAEDLRKGGKLLELDLHAQTFAFRTVFADGATDVAYPALNV